MWFLSVAQRATLLTTWTYHHNTRASFLDPQLPALATAVPSALGKLNAHPFSLLRVLALALLENCLENA